MKETKIREAQEALERLLSASGSESVEADAEAVRSLLSDLASMQYVPDWGVYADGEPNYCPTKAQATSLLRFCNARNPDGGAYLIRRDQLRGEWVAEDTTKETHV